MSDGITRRDFLNGVALTIGAGLAPGCRTPSAALTGGAPVSPTQITASARSPEPWRGNTDAAAAAAHDLRDGRHYALRALPVAETVDLVIVGAGISGLAAAHYFRQRSPGARILILDNHDDFGGHARRCELQVEGRLILGYGGSESLQSPAGLWSEGARALLVELGVELKRFETYFDRTLYPGLGLSRAVLFKKEAFGVDKLVSGDPTRMVADDIPKGRLNARPAAAFIGDFPLPEAARAKLLALYTEARDVLPGKTLEQKRALLASISYREFLVRCWELDDASANTFQKRSHDFFAIGIDGLPALDAAGAGYPGFDGLGQGLRDDPVARAELEEPYIYHFPDGNASLARLLVRRLMPEVAPGDTMEDVVTARFDYRHLDVAGQPTRLRLNSTVVAISGSHASKVDIGYVHGGVLRRVQARGVIAAGYNMMLPYMMSELGPQQSQALSACVKAPLVYAKVAVRNWQPWAALGVHEVTNPMGFFSRIKLDYPVSIGAYRFPSSPREPMGLHLVHVPTPSAGSGDQRSAWRTGRTRLSALPFALFERMIRDELTRIVGAAGFEAQRDIAAIAIYRWAHGYAYGFNSLYDREQARALPQLARQLVGRVAIANSDAAWSADAHAAIDEAARAVRELG